jgi:hypothetical protein
MLATRSSITPPADNPRRSPGAKAPSGAAKQRFNEILAGRRGSQRRAPRKDHAD